MEDYLISIKDLDFGDLPDDQVADTPDYATDYDDDGPRHGLAGTPLIFIGTGVEQDDNGQASTDADGDAEEDDVTLPAMLFRGENATFNMNVTNNSDSTAKVVAYFDWNGDGDFEDSNETILTGVSLGGEPQQVIEGLSADIVIPTNAKTGLTRMRVAMQRGTYPTECGTVAQGEVEDYILNLQGAATIGERKETTVFNTGKPISYTSQERTKDFELNLFPNPSSDYIHLEWEDNQARIFDLSIYNSLGQLQNYQQLTTQKGANKAKIDLTQFSEGLYLLHLRNKDKLITKEFVVIK